MEAVSRSLRCFRTSKSFLRAGSSNASQIRHERNLILKQNRDDPKLEEAARKRKLLVPLSDISTEWRRSYDGLKQLETVATHFDVFKSMFTNVFRFHGYMGVAYGDGNKVYRGNVLYPHQVWNEPTITLPTNLGKEELCTLTLTNLDGHLYDNSKEVLHWMVANIPTKGPVTSGVTLYPYVPPLPPQGTGVHRMIFTLYSHATPISNDQSYTDTVGSWFDKRAFSTKSFLLSHSNLRPITIAFFQTLWDPFVSETYTSLGIEEPVYGLKKDLTPRRLAQLAVKEARQQRYNYL